MSSRKPHATDRVRARAKLWLEAEEDYVLGLGIAEILAAVERTGSIKEAAEEVDKSYRHVWARIKAVEERLGVELVRTQVGGAERRRSALAPGASELVSAFLELRERVFALVEEEYAARLRPALERLLEDGQSD